MGSITRETLKVLYVEDDVNDIYLINAELGRHYRVVWEKVETESMLIISLDSEWDVILCDYKMPKLTAERALVTVRQHTHNPNIPFIVISGIIKEDIAIEMLKKGANDFIQKFGIGEREKAEKLILVIRREIRASRERAGEALRTQVRINESYEATLLAWGRALELRDHYTSGHTVRVTDLCLRLAMMMKIPHYQFVSLHRGSLLHDIGKMGIPDAILLKRDVLTDEEMNIMKQHPRLAKEMLEGIPFLKDAVAVPYSHHERWNGTGYPQGLKHLEIPFLARLFSICDVYDALTSDRPYRESWDKAHTIAYIVDERGITFDPTIVDAFVEMVGRG